MTYVNRSIKNKIVHDKEKNLKCAKFSEMYMVLEKLLSLLEENLQFNYVMW